MAFIKKYQNLTCLNFFQRDADDIATSLKFGDDVVLFCLAEDVCEDPFTVVKANEIKSKDALLPVFQPSGMLDMPNRMIPFTMSTKEGSKIRTDVYLLFAFAQQGMTLDMVEVDVRYLNKCFRAYMRRKDDPRKFGILSDRLFTYARMIRNFVGAVFQVLTSD